MLGDKIANGQGRVTGTRILPPDGPGPTVEASIQGSGTYLGVATTDMWTYQQVMRPDGTIVGEGRGVSMTADGEVVTWTGQGVGRPTGRGAGVAYRTAVFGQTASHKLARLNQVVLVGEYDVDEDGSYRYEAWEWK